MIAKVFGAYVVLGCAVLAGAGAWGQSQDAALERELARLGKTADALDHALPSFTCRETGSSEIWMGKKLKQQVNFSATLRARRGDSGSHMETFALTELNGEPYTGRYMFPFYVSGGFDKGMRYFAPNLQVCYRYALLPGRIDFATAPDAATRAGCHDEGMRGFALLDADGEVTHLERTVTPRAVEAYRLAPFTAIDYAPVELNGETFRLSQHMVSEHTYERTRTRFEVNYTECRLFHVTVTMGEPGPPIKEPVASGTEEGK